jgi:hypothetical protein
MEQIRRITEAEIAEAIRVGEALALYSRWEAESYEDADPLYVRRDAEARAQKPGTLMLPGSNSGCVSPSQRP